MARVTFRWTPSCFRYTTGWSAGQGNPCSDGCVLPTSFCPSSGFLTNMLPEDDQSARAKAHDLWPAVTIYAPVQNSFGGQGSLEPNKIFEQRGPEPDFLTEFRAKLRQRRWIESDTVTVCIFLITYTLVIEDCHRTLRFSRMNFASLKTTLKTHLRASSKKTVSPANANCITSQARFYARIGRKAIPSKWLASGGSLTR